jgi:host factor-I protein
MQSHFEQRGPRLDTTSPSVRHLQELIRHATQVNISMEGGEQLRGTIRWQDADFVALQQEHDLPLVLLNRSKVVLLRALG